MGYIEETGVAQHYRDVRIAAIYEGTNGVQAADLVGRKLGVRRGSSFNEYIAEIGSLDKELAKAGKGFASIRANLADSVAALKKTTGWMLRHGLGDPNSILAGSSPYLRMWGVTLGGWLLAKGALAAAELGDRKLAENKLVLARFYAEQLLPQAAALVGAATAGKDDLFALDAAALA
jgi:hypothetical protein